jgi:hypothetical protein
MPARVRDVFITPDSRTIDFYNNSLLKATIYELNDNLFISIPNGFINLGDGTAANVELGASGTAVDLDFIGGGTITSRGNPLNLGISGDIFNFNVTGVTYNFPSLLARDNEVVKLSGTQTISGDKTFSTNISATSINKVSFTTPATGSTLTIANGKTLTASESITLAGDAARTLTINTANKTLAGAATTLTFGGNFTHTGAHTLGLTTSANTSVTLPTSGTLATTTQISDAFGNISISTNTISSTNTNGNIELTPNGTGDVNLNADTIRIGDQNVNATLTTYGTGDLILSTNSGTNSGTFTIYDGASGHFAMMPNGSGNVGIGIINPTGTLTVQKTNSGGIGASLALVNYGTSGTVGSAASIDFGLEASTYSDTASNAQIKAILESANNSTSLVFSTWNGTAFAERFRVLGSGNVGIGLSDPDEKLEVAGSIKLSGAIKDATYPSNSFINLNDDQTMYSNAVSIGSVDVVAILSDTNGNDAADHPAFDVFTGSLDVDLGTNLFRILKNGNTSVNGDIKIAANKSYNFDTSASIKYNSTTKSIEFIFA